MSEPVSVKLVDHEFLLACEPDEREGLNRAAAFLDAHMRDLRNGAQGAGFDRLVVLAAVDIAHQLIESREQQEQRIGALADKLEALRHKLEQTLAQVPAPL